MVRPVTDRASIFRVGAAQLAQRDFRRLFIARFVSAFGSVMAPVAMVFAVLDLTDSPGDVGMVIASGSLAQACVQLLGGTLADRWSRQYVMVSADLLASASQAAMAYLLLTGQAQVWQLCLLMAVNGVGFAFHHPAGIGLVPQVVQREHLQSANALLSLSGSAAAGLGGAAAGIIVALWSAGWAIAGDAFTFALSAWLIVGIRPGPQERSAAASIFRELRDGWHEFISHRWLWSIVLQFSLVVMAFQGCFMVLGPIVAERSMDGPADWAWVAGGFGAGLLVGGLIGMGIEPRYPMRLATFMVFFLALPLMLLAGPSPLALIVAGTFLTGVAIEIFSVLWFTALHTRVAPEALSRVSAYDILGSIALAPLGEAAAGPLSEALGMSETLFLGAAFIVVPTLLVLAVAEVRNMESLPSGQT